LDEKGVQVFQVGKTYEQRNMRLVSNITPLAQMGFPVGDVIWNRIPFEMAVNPAKAGIYSASHWKCDEDGLDSGLHWNDRHGECRAKARRYARK
jgi:hypothetical protein